MQSGSKPIEEGKDKKAPQTLIREANLQSKIDNRKSI